MEKKREGGREIEKQEEKIGMWGYFNNNSGIFTVLGIFLIFFWQLNPEVIKNEATATYLWLFSGIIIIIIFSVLCYQSTSDNYKFGRLLPIYICLIMINFLVIYQFLSDIFLNPDKKYALILIKSILSTDNLINFIPSLLLYLSIFIVIILIKRRIRK